MVEYGDRTVPYYFSVGYCRYDSELRTRVGQDGTYIQNMHLHLQSSGYYTGVVSFGSSERRIAVVDFNGNGVFNEYFKPPADIKGPEKRLYATGDQILLGGLPEVAKTSGPSATDVNHLCCFQKTLIR